MTDSLSAPPDDFTPAETKAWHMIASKAPLGVLTDADWPSVVIAAVLWAEFRADPAAFNTARLTRLHRILGDFGLNPADRASLSIPKPKEALAKCAWNVHGVFSLLLRGIYRKA